MQSPEQIIYIDYSILPRQRSDYRTGVDFQYSGSFTHHSTVCLIGSPLEEGCSLIFLIGNKNTWERRALGCVMTELQLVLQTDTNWKRLLFKSQFFWHWRKLQSQWSYDKPEKSIGTVHLDDFLVCTWENMYTCDMKTVLFIGDTIFLHRRVHSSRDGVIRTLEGRNLLTQKLVLGLVVASMRLKFCSLWIT